MDKLGIKATIYDVLGYAVPGAILLVGLYVFTTGEFKPDIALLMKTEVSGAFAAIAFLAFYVTGHLLSSVSSFLFENKSFTAVAAWIFDFDTTRYDEAALRIFGKNYAECGSRAVIVYCQSNYPLVYETAFAFLTIYGLSRNVAAAMLLLIPLWVTKNSDWVFVSIYLMSLAFMVRNYLRFKVYYIHQIASSLMIAKKAP